jgi:ATP-binding cassette subfamily F protein 3
MDGLATSVVELHDGVADRHLGTWSDFRDRRDAELKRQAQLDASRAQAEEKARKAAASAARKAAPAPRSSVRTVRWTVDALEKKIFAIEEQLTALAERLSDPELHRDPHVSTQVTQEYEALQRECAELTETWEELGSS